ncbi:hypothetical protein GP475_04705 [Corynebacterium poyangense]|uniref:Uncharacterized protein n=1 Tax=Corynebacterium poyangense TaxID=2684405 RepID=A0A7H0SN96_9CORY|nr:hypothetical protein [Corynebacterium poyangense]MBZ8177043.1 hypothetical protein [Corynebacterium poyangense]QNQ90021.1 hypothetical protein GP475_04705 [Corynebacterium poyangense]
MSFFEDIAVVLDQEGLESRVHGDTMLIPISSEIEIHLVEIDPILPAANLYITAAESDEDEEGDDGSLVAVVFSVDDAIREISTHVATDQVVTILRDLLEGTDERIEDLEFLHDGLIPNLVVAEVAENSELQVLVETVEGIPTATVSMVSFGDPEAEGDDAEYEEILSLGSFSDVDRLFDVLALAAERADEWEEQLIPLD